MDFAAMGAEIAKNGILGAMVVALVYALIKVTNQKDAQAKEFVEIVKTITVALTQATSALSQASEALDRSSDIIERRAKRP